VKRSRIIVLQPAGIVEEVSVSAQPPPLDSRETSVATVIDSERIEDLPCVPGTM
jgi:hypothetical protein